MMFLRSIVSVFSGCSAFPELAKRNPFRAVFHLLLFCLLLACLCGGFRVWKAGHLIDRSVKGLEDHFGAVTVSSAGYVPEKNGAAARTFYLPGGVRLDYLKLENLPIVKDMVSWQHRQGIFWVPRGFVMWLHPDPARDAFYLAQIPYPYHSAYLLSPVKLQTLRPFKAAEVMKYLDQFFIPSKEQIDTVEQFTFSRFGSLLKSCLYMMFVIGGAGSYFTLTLVMILMFGLMQTFWRAPGLESLGFGGTVSLLSYAAYPSVTAGMLLESFSFPVGSEIVFFVMFFISQLLAFNEVRRSLSGGEDR